MIRIIFDRTLGNGEGGVQGWRSKSDPWIILRPFCTLYFQRCAHGLVDLWINLTCLNFEPFSCYIFFRRWIVGLILFCLCMPFYFLFRIFWCKYKAPHFGSYFFHTNWWMISFLELAFVDHIFYTQIGGSFLFCNLHFWIIFFHTNWWVNKCKIQKRNDPPIHVDNMWYCYYPSDHFS